MREVAHGFSHFALFPSSWKGSPWCCTREAALSYPHHNSGVLDGAQRLAQSRGAGGQLAPGILACDGVDDDDTADMSVQAVSMGILDSLKYLDKSRFPA